MGVGTSVAVGVNMGVIVGSGVRVAEDSVVTAGSGISASFFTAGVGRLLTGLIIFRT